jgi:glutamate 5-kinase
LNNDQIAVDLAVNHKARMLLLLTDVAGVLERRKWWWGMKRMETIKRSEIPAVQAALADARGAKGAVVGTGGMAEKLRQAARVSPETTVVIASAKIPRVIERVVHEEDRRIGTWIVPG